MNKIQLLAIQISSFYWKSFLMLLKVKDSQINNNISEAPLQSLCSTLASTWQETVPLQKYFWKININDLVQQRERKREREWERGNTDYLQLFLKSLPISSKCSLLTPYENNLGNQRFSDIFRRHQKGALGRNGFNQGIIWTQGIQGWTK